MRVPGPWCVCARWLVIFMMWACCPTHAQTPTLFEEQGQVIRGSPSIATLGPDLFGDSVSLYTGALEFRQTDVSLPGNNALPVSVGRRRTTGTSRVSSGAFGDWDLDIPHIKGVFATADGWNSGGAGVPADKYKRCSNFDEPADALTTTRQVLVMAQDYWFGNYLYVPGRGEQELLQRLVGGTVSPNDGLSYPVLTKAGWALRCITSLPNGQVGEGFIAVSPEGTQYRFDWLVSRTYSPYRAPPLGGSLARAAASGAPSAGRNVPSIVQGNLLLRSEVWLLPTLVTDRFGNTVTYTYLPAKPWQLQSIQSSDGRSIKLTYVPGTNLVQSVSRNVSMTLRHPGTLI